MVEERDKIVAISPITVIDKRDDEEVQKDKSEWQDDVREDQADGGPEAGIRAIDKAAQSEVISAFDNIRQNV